MFSLGGGGTSPRALPEFYFSMVGASRSQLQGWGYRVTDVESVDRGIAQCVGLRLEPRAECWARLDQYLMTEVVPWVPYMVEEETYLTSSHVLSMSFSIDPAYGVPSFDRIALEPQGTS